MFALARGDMPSTPVKLDKVLRLKDRPSPVKQHISKKGSTEKASRNILAHADADETTAEKFKPSKRPVPEYKSNLCDPCNLQNIRYLRQDRRSRFNTDAATRMRTDIHNVRTEPEYVKDEVMFQCDKLRRIHGDNWKQFWTRSQSNSDHSQTGGSLSPDNIGWVGAVAQSRNAAGGPRGKKKVNVEAVITTDGHYAGQSSTRIVELEEGVQAIQIANPITMKLADGEPVHVEKKPEKGLVAVQRNLAMKKVDEDNREAARSDSYRLARKAVRRQHDEAKSGAISKLAASKGNSPGTGSGKMHGDRPGMVDHVVLADDWTGAHEA